MDKYIRPEKDIPGWMAESELEWLFQTAAEMDVVVEIGSWQGRSTHAIASGCRGTVFAVDHFRGSPSEINGSHALAKTANIRELFDRHMGGFSNVTVLEMDSVEASKWFEDGTVDMVFIDGEHTYDACRADILAWLPKCRRLLCGHDSNQDGVPKAIAETLGKVEHGPNSIWRFDKCGH